ncbi:mediator of RNA polymerase II transcription subunit 12-like isoform X2 [Periplaneta americana]|uniref:mediator of RNA polymerase II transcription subunit 12-like isoform X2 n=1 Tax=Periplaneta americana TaxID=6978 RepID=UPI0037E803EB
MATAGDSDLDEELVTLLAESKCKLWEEKKRLGLQADNNSGTFMQTSKNTHDGGKENQRLYEDIREQKKQQLISRISSGSPGFGRQEHKKGAQSVTNLPNDVRSCKKDELISKLTVTEGLVGIGEPKGVEEERSSRSNTPLPSDVRSCKKDELISKLTLTEGLVGIGENITEEEAEPMVRFGEYSPQNPGLLSPGKTLLGLGEYEEKRRQILERKKREYLEQMAQARQNVKDSVPARFNEQNHESSEFRYRISMNNKCSAGTQTDLQITGYIHDAGYNYVHSGSITPMAAATQTPGGEISMISNPSPYITNMYTQTSCGGLRAPKYDITPVTDTGIATLPQPSSYLPLSPRERKMAEFSESYSPSFLQGPPIRPGGFDMTMEQAPEFRRRREAYQEELRKQIEEKRRLEAEKQKKDEEEEAAIARRAELQRERMRQEYMQEEALRRERHLQRMRQAEEFQRKQEALKLEAELEREAEARRKLEKRLEDLEAGLAHHASYSSQVLGVSLPVPALRTKFSKSESPKESSHSRSPSVGQDVSEDKHSDTQNPVPPSVDSNSNFSSHNRSAESLQVSEMAKLYPQSDNTLSLRDRGAENIQLYSNTRLSPHINDETALQRKSPVPSDNTGLSPNANIQSSDSECSNNNRTDKENNEVVTISYHRPPSEIIKAAGYDTNLRHYDNEYRSRHPAIPESEVQNVPPAPSPPQDTNNNKKKLEDSLPIPILRAPSPVIPAARIGQATSGSEAMRRLEAKWEVPAVEKNRLHTDSNPNNILTQLGAVRHQLQLEQLRMEQHLLQQRLKNTS